MSEQEKEQETTIQKVNNFRSVLLLGLTVTGIIVGVISFFETSASAKSRYSEFDKRLLTQENETARTSAILCGFAIDFKLPEAKKVCNGLK